MALTDIQKQFHQNADDIIKKQPKKLRNDDKAKIRYIRKSMKNSPIGAKLLGWADDNDIKIVVDHQINAGGYYYNGMKFIGLRSLSVHTMAHEIMHAVQDEMGLLPSLEGASIQELKDNSVQDYLSQTHFAEATAYAIGGFVEEDVIRNSSKSKYKTRFSSMVDFCLKHFLFRKELDYLTKEQMQEDLKQRFTEYFETSYLRKTYENRHLNEVAKAIGVKGIVVPDNVIEYDLPDFKSPYSSGFNLNDEQDARRIGDVIGEFNFLDGLPANFNKTAKFRQLKTNFSLANDVEDTLPRACRINKALLFRQVKHWQKQQSY